MLVEGCYVFLVAGKAVERLGHNDVEPSAAGILQQLLITRAQAAGAAGCRIGIACRKLPPLLLDALAADPNLILDRGFALKVGRIAGVNGGTHCDLSPMS
jgi:hypothetical protein